LAVASIVDSLEESEVVGIGGVCDNLGSHVLDSDMGMTNDATSLQRLRGRVVGHIGVGERPGCEVGDLDLEVNGGVLSDVLAVGRADHDSRNHLVGCGDVSHDCLWSEFDGTYEILESLPIPLQEPPLT
jgi:hypothetical protein